MTIAKLLPVACALLLVGCASPKPEAPTAGPMGQIETLKDFEAQRASSSHPDWRNANRDAIEIAPGAIAEIASLEGPGKIVHLWFTVSHPDQQYASKMVLRIYWDGEEKPSVECPLGDFFGVGMGLDRDFSSIPVRVSAEGRARNCYWPMPFRKSARVTITNESEQACRGFYYYVDWQKHKSIPADAAYFHAMYRQEFPCTSGTNYVIADIQGRGHYVGTVQSVYQTMDGWYGEGDDFFFIDGAPEPVLRGTGTEDYFCDAWGFRPQEGPFYGVPVYEGRKTGDRVSAYRFHVPDPVPFKESLRVEIEHKGQKLVPGRPADPFAERDDLMSSVAFWYQTEPHKPWPALPAAFERLPYTMQLVFAGTNVVETARHSEDPVQAQSLAGRGARKQLWFKAKTEGAWVEVPFRLDSELVADLVLVMSSAPDYGAYQVLLDGTAIAAVDLYAPAVTRSEHRLGRVKLTPGEHVLRFECSGKNGLSRGYFMGLERLTALVPAYFSASGAP